MGMIPYGPTALQIMSVALPNRLEDWDEVHIVVNDRDTRPHRNGVIAHWTSLPLKPWRKIRGFPVLHPIEHWLQIDHATADEMTEIGDGFLRRKNPYLTSEEMQRRLDSLHGMRGVRRAREAMRLVRAGTDSIYESKTRLVLVRAGLPSPDVNPPIWCPVMGFEYHVDMAYPAAKIAIEFDGRVHADDQQRAVDADKTRNLQELGWMVITVTAQQLRTPDSFVRSVENALIFRMHNIQKLLTS